MSGNAHHPTVVVTVTAEGTVNAETHGVLGESCLDYVAVLEELLEATTVNSEYTPDFTRSTTDLYDYQEDYGVEKA